MLTIPGPRQRGFCDGVTRRDFLRVGGLALGGMALPQILEAEAQKRAEEPLPTAPEDRPTDGWGEQ